jgi:RNA polymerase sigma-70 factor (ECF subfamily)
VAAEPVVRRDAVRAWYGARPMAEAEDDRALIARVLDGDVEAVNALVDRHHAPMASVVGAIVRDPSQVPDVVQEAWIRVLAGLRGFEHRASLKAWILRVTANTARTMAARLGRLPLPIDVDDGGADPAVPPAAFSSIGRWRDPPQPWSSGEPEAVLLRKELGAMVLRHLERLPPLQRAVVLLRDVEELPADEIRGMLEIGDVNLRVLLHRGRARLRAAIDEELKRR